MPVIDIHTHVFPPQVAERAVGSLVDRAGLRPFYDGTVEGLLGIMDRSGVDVAVLCPVATRLSQTESINDWTASVATPRLVPFGSVHPTHPDPAGEVERMAALGLRGIKLHPEFQDFEPDDPLLNPLYRAAVAHSLPILFHAGADPNYESIKGVPLAFRRMIAEHPDLTVILAHLGGYRVWDEVAEHLMGERVYLDTAYTLGHLPDDEIAAIVRGHGVDRILFGSDGPWTDPADEIRRLRALDLPAEDVESILWRNAAELLGIPVHGLSYPLDLPTKQ